MEPRALARLAPARAAASTPAIQSLVRDLNHAYRAEPALWSQDSTGEGFRWLEPNDADANVIAFARLIRGTRARRRVRREQLAGRAAGLPRGAAARRALARAAEHRLAPLRRLRRRQRAARSRPRAGPLARPGAVGGDHAAAAGRALARPGGAGRWARNGCRCGCGVGVDRRRWAGERAERQDGCRVERRVTRG